MNGLVIVGYKGLKMVTLVKHEWHQVDSQFAFELTEEILAEIYPDLDEAAITEMMYRIENGEIDVDDIINDAWENDVEIEWERQYDDWWTDRKGGYEVTYELGDESSWHEEPVKEDTHKCTKCKWTGQSYEADWWWPDEHTTDDLELESKKVCPYCESDLELTEHGKVEEEARKKRMEEIDAMLKEEEDDD